MDETEVTMSENVKTG